MISAMAVNEQRAWALYKPVLCLWQPNSAELQQQRGRSFYPSVPPPSGASVHAHRCRGPVGNSHLCPCLETTMKTHKTEKRQINNDLVLAISVLPRPHNSRFSQSQRKLSSTFNLTDALPVEPLYVLRDVTAFTASTAQLPKVPITPGEHQTWQKHTRHQLQLSTATEARIQFLKRIKYMFWKLHLVSFKLTGY